SSLGSLARSRYGTRLVERPVARFPLCALLAAAALYAVLAAPRRRIVRRSGSLERARAAARGGAAAAAGLAAGACSPGTVRGQSAWSQGDAAFKKGDWAKAESLYAKRARQPRPPAGVLANLATARAQHAPDDSVERQLSHLSTRNDAVGQLTGYNLGTLMGRRGDLDAALGELRRAIERDPTDMDARWNYEWLSRQRDESAKNPETKPDQQPDHAKPPPQPDQRPGQGSPQDQPPPSGGQSPSPQAQTPPAPGTQQPMTRKQAEELLGSLGDLE